MRADRSFLLVITDYTIDPQKNGEVLQRTFHGCSARRRILRKHYLHMFSFCEGLSNDDVGVTRGSVFQEIRPGELLSKQAISLKKRSGRLT